MSPPEKDAVAPDDIDSEIDELIIEFGGVSQGDQAFAFAGLNRMRQVPVLATLHGHAATPLHNGDSTKQGKRQPADFASTELLKMRMTSFFAMMVGLKASARAVEILQREPGPGQLRAGQSVYIESHHAAKERS